MKNNVKATFILTLIVFAFLPALLFAKTEERFEEPDVKDDFCGIHINFQYCKCAFHNEKPHCSAVSMDDWSARIHVMAEFRKWVGDKMEAFARKCLADGYTWNLPSMACIHETPGTEPPGATLEEKYGLPDVTFLDIPKNPKVMGSIAVANGEIFLYSASFKKWRGPIKSGQPIYQGDIIFTTKRGGGTLRMYSDEIFTDFTEIAPGTFFETFPPDEPWDPSLFGVLKRGAVEIYDAVTGKPQPPTWYNQIHTPTVVVGTRGTNYILAYNEETGVSEVFLREGEIRVTPQSGGEPFVLSPGSFYRNENGKITTGEFDVSTWEAKAESFGISSEHRVATAEDFLIPTGGPVDDIPDDGFTREELVGDLSFVEDQFGGGSFGTILVTIIILLAAGTGFFFWKKKRVS